MKITKFEELKSWQKARELTKEVYKVTNADDFVKDWGLKDQIRRASGSIMHNIAEGFDSGSDNEFTRFLRYAQRSATEVMSQLYVALGQNYISQEEFEYLVGLNKEAHKLIGGFIRYLTKD